MRRFSTIIAAAAVITASIPAQAQVAKEITVEREVIPTLRDASPLPFTPAYQLPAVAKPTLSYSERTTTARIPALFPFLEPAAVADTIPASPWRGYVGAGYFPIFHGALSAGYRIIDAPKTTFDLWLQYDGRRYNTDIPAAEPVAAHVITQDAAAGFAIAQKVRSSNRLDIGFDYALGRFNNPAGCITDATIPYWQTSNRADLDILFTGRTNDLGYSLGADYRYFGFARTISNPLPIRPIRESDATLSAALFADIDQAQSYRLDITAAILARAASGQYSDPSRATIIPRGSDASGLITITPSYTLARRKVNLTLGARIDLSISDGRFFHIAPAVKAAWTPSPFFTLYGRAGGGEIRNTTARLYAIDRFILPYLHYANSHMPIEAEGGFRVGPFRGAHLGVSAVWAAVNDALMPYALSYGEVAFQGSKLRGWQFRAEAGYDWRGKAAIKVEGAITPGSATDIEKGFRDNTDRARYTLDASLTLRPLQPLEVTASYSLRASRRMLHYVETTTPLGITTATVAATSLPNISNLSLGASWAFNPRLSAFARFENILNRRSPSFSLIESDGFHGLFGIIYKF